MDSSSQHPRELSDDEFYELSAEDQFQYLESRPVPGKISNEKGERCVPVFNAKGKAILRPLPPIGSEYRDEIEAAKAHLGDCSVFSDEGEQKEFEEEYFA